MLEFLSELYSVNNAGYSAVNKAKSALSNIVQLTDSQLPVGKHPRIKQYMRGVFNLRPSLPKYSVTWDVTVVLSYLRSLPLNDIHLKNLSLKLVMLLALLAGQRVQTLKCLKVNELSLSADRVELFITSLLKTSKPGKHLSSISFQKYEEENLCIVKHISLYIEKTASLRSSEQLLISYNKPHQPISTNTISRWIKLILKMSGVNTDVFSAHSTRAACASTALTQGVPVDTILSKVGWQSEATFAKFYSKPIEQQIDTAILNMCK